MFVSRIRLLLLGLESGLAVFMWRISVDAMGSIYIRTLYIGGFCRLACNYKNSRHLIVGDGEWRGVIKSEPCYFCIKNLKFLKFLLVIVLFCEGEKVEILCEYGGHVE